MTEKRKATVEIVGDDLTIRRTNVPSLGICIVFPESPNASKTTNNIVTVKKYIDTYLPTLSGERPSPLARLLFLVRCCWAVMSRLIGIQPYHTNNNNISVGNFKHRKG